MLQQSETTLTIQNTAKQNASKYYVQSGSIKWVLLAPDIYKAATRFAKVLFKPTMSGRQKLSPQFSLINEKAFCKKVLQLGPKMLVSQSGFDGPTIGIFDTSEIIAHYRKQVQAIESILRKQS